MPNMTAVNHAETSASANVSAVVRMLLAGRGEKFDVLTTALGIGRTTTFEKVSGKRRWYAEEVQALADFFGVPVATFYAGVGGVLTQLTDTGNFHTDDQQALFTLPLAS